MKALITALFLSSVLSVSAYSKCADEAAHYSNENLTQKLQSMPKFANSEISFDTSQIGQYKNGVTLKASSKTEEFYESTIAGLIKNENTGESEFMVQRCLLFIKLETCELNDRKCTVI